MHDVSTNQQQRTVPSISLWDKVLIIVLFLALGLTIQTFFLHVESITALARAYISTSGFLPRNPNLALMEDGATIIHSFNIEVPFYGPNMWRFTVSPEDTSITQLSHTCGQSSSPLVASATSDQYWCFMGPRGQLGIALSYPGFLTNISVDHPATISSLTNAPRDIVVWGAVDGSENEERYKQSVNTIQALQSRLRLHPPFPPQEDKELVYVPLATAFYNIRSPDLFQTFKVFPEIHALEMDFGLVAVQIVSNWGGTSTSLHHMGVYGKVVEGV